MVSGVRIVIDGYKIDAVAYADKVLVKPTAKIKAGRKRMANKNKTK